VTEEHLANSIKARTAAPRRCGAMDRAGCPVAAGADLWRSTDPPDRAGRRAEIRMDRRKNGSTEDQLGALRGRRCRGPGSQNDRDLLLVEASSSIAGRMLIGPWGDRSSVWRASSWLELRKPSGPTASAARSSDARRPLARACVGGGIVRPSGGKSSRGLRQGNRTRAEGKESVKVYAKKTRQPGIFVR